MVIEAGQDGDAVNGVAILRHEVSGGDYGSVPALLVAVAIADDDERGVLVSTRSLSVGEGGRVSYTVVLRSQPTGAVEVAIGVVARTDYAGVPLLGPEKLERATLMFAVADWNVAQTVIIEAGQDDDAVDGKVTLGHEVSGGDYGLVTVPVVAVAVADDDERGVLVSTSSLAVGEGGRVSYTVVLRSQPTGTVEVAIGVVARTDYAGVPLLGPEKLERATLRFAAADWNAAQTVIIEAGQDDDAVDGKVTLGHEVSGGDYGSETAPPVAVAIADDDERGVLVSTSSLVVSEGGRASYRVVLRSQPTGTVEVAIEVVAPSDYAGALLLGPEKLERATLRFAVADWNAARTVIIEAGQDDDAVDGRAILRHEVSGGDYGSVTASAVSVAVADDDERGVLVSTSSLAVGEGGRASYTVALTSQPTGTVEVEVRSNNASVLLGPEKLGQVALTFGVDDWDAAQTVAIETSQDDAVDGRAILSHEVSGGDYGSVTVPPVTVVDDTDRDGDGLIEVYNLTDLHSMRHDLAGTSYQTGAASVGDSSGCPDTGCMGYELMQDLDFDADNDGSTWSGNADDGYTLDSEDSQADYFPVESGEGGWLPIGDDDNPFVAVFDGNSHTISNLAIRRDQTLVGLLGAIGAGAAIHNLGLIDNLADYIGSSSNSISIGDVDVDGIGGLVGGLVGLQEGGSITASYATGAAAGGDGDADIVGGLVGLQFDGSITASYAMGATAGGDGGDGVGGLVGSQFDGSIMASYATGVTTGGVGSDTVGGLVGSQFDGSITASYAMGAAAGGDGGDSVGGLVGHQTDGSITASWATGAAAGGGGSDAVGGLVGLQDGGSIAASYATGATDGGDGEEDAVGGLVGARSYFGGSTAASHITGAINGGGGGDRDAVGGLVGQQRGGSITTSYATGDASGGVGSDVVGGLVGAVQSGTIAASYATGAADGGGGDSDEVGGLAGVVQSSTITASYATGDADGGGGVDDRVGGLVGVVQSSTITASYGFGKAMGGVEGSEGSEKPEGVSTAEDLAGDDFEQVWSDFWDFGNSDQIPALKNAEDTLLPGQDDVTASGPSTVESGGTVRLTGSLRFDRATILSWSWRQLEGTAVTLSNANASETSFTAPATGTRLVFELTATDSDDRQYTDRITLTVTAGPSGPDPSGPDPDGGGPGSGGGGGGGSMGLWALVALVLLLLLGPRPNQGRAVGTEICAGRPSPPRGESRRPGALRRRKVAPAKERHPC